MFDHLMNIILNVLIFAFIGFLIYLYLEPEPDIEGWLAEEGKVVQED
jgi:uncharacterized membrane protein